tara:strand:+ start:2038 stop:2256 length:219 start_codon:yes stop_codon:yes gene_type:complete
MTTSDKIIAIINMAQHGCNCGDRSCISCTANRSVNEIAEYVNRQYEHVIESLKMGLENQEFMEKEMGERYDR